MKKENARFVIWISVFAMIAETLFYLYQLDKAFESEIISSPSKDYWQVFAKITKERTYIEEAGAYYRIPVFTPEILDLSGKEITLLGYFLPFSKLDSAIIISRYPNSSCFYCGLAGIESVAMVEIGGVNRKYGVDQRIIVKGKLALNTTNVKKLAFVLEDAMVEVVN